MKPTVVFANLPKELLGTCNCNTGIIVIDLTKDQRSPGLVLVHELTHFCNPEMEEDEVMARSWLQWHKMNQEQRLELYRRLFRRVRCPH
jgi:hypothetical protein